MERTAQCVCGQLSVTVEGEPARVNLCNCQTCQRRTGSAFQLGAFFDKGQVKSMDGEAKTYTRTAESGRKIDMHFCPTCGVTVYFHAEVRPSLVAVPVGCFADSSFPAPGYALWTEHKHHWLTLPEVEHSFEQQAP